MENNIGDMFFYFYRGSFADLVQAFYIRPGIKKAFRRTLYKINTKKINEVITSSVLLV